MDMETDFPDLEELEWLETNAEVGEEEGWVVEEDAGVEDAPPASKIPDPPPSRENQIGRKRPWPEEVETDEIPGDSERMLPDERRGSKRRSLEDEVDEDWLRYSPPKDAVPDDIPPRVDDAAPPLPEEMILSRFASEIEGDCMSITAPSGDRVYAKISSAEMDAELRRITRDKPANGLLNEHINILIDRMEHDSLTKALQESIDLPDPSARSTTSIVTGQLWVEKYSPNSFKELLSDEQTNREVLLWLKQWDSCVFGSQIRATEDDVLSALRHHSSIVLNQKTFANHFSKGAPFNNFSNKSSHIFNGENKLNGVPELSSRKLMTNQPPEQKVLLLCGPPGLGKTTLAHVAAKHCGYGVVEINASDDRSSSTFETKFRNVMEMRSVLGDFKPKCLVIDEIDGALGEGKGAVDVILKMVAAEKKPTTEKGKNAQESQPGKVSSRKGQKTTKLSRPVICICNDLYAPALRPLRQVAKVHTFVQPTVSRVVNRLKYICKQEGFMTNSIALSTLAEYTECDIRACLNTLQFLHKKKESLNILEVGSQVVGRKDVSRSAFDVWKEVFQKRKLKRERKSIAGFSGPGEFDFLYSLISNCGDYELTMNGIHENFLQLSYHDPMMQKTVRCLDVLGVSDSLLQYILRTQQMSLLAYQPPIAITMRHLIAQVEKPNIEWPKSLQRCRAMLMERKELLKLWRNKITPSLSRHLSAESFVEDIASQFLHILSPPTLRPVALHLLSEREKGDLAQLVDTMVSYSITYKHSKPDPLQKTQIYGVPSDAPLFSLDPPIDDFMNFKDYQSGHIGLSLAMKQILVHEVEKQRILRESIGRSGNLTDETSIEKEAPPVINGQVSPPVILTPPTSYEVNLPKASVAQMKKIGNAAPNSFSDTNKKFPMIGMNTKAPADTRRPTRSSSSFFDRFRKGSGLDSKNPGDIMPKSATTERDSHLLLFKYNEGFTNAVKRPVKIRDLLLW